MMATGDTGLIGLAEHVREALSPGVLPEVFASFGQAVTAVWCDRLVDTDNGFVIDLVTGSGEPSARFIAQFLPGNITDQATIVAASLRKRRRGQLGTDEEGVWAVPELSMVLRRSGLDERLQGLDLLAHPERAAGPLGTHVGDHTSVELLAHRLGKRAVLRVRGSEGSVVVKLGKQRSDLPAIVSTLGEGFRTSSRQVTPHHLGYLPDRNATVWEDLGRHDGSQWGPLPVDPSDAAAAVKRFQRMAPVPGIERHGPDAESRIVWRHIELVGRIRPDLAIAVASIGGTLIDRLARLPAAPSVLVHRDLHPGQLVAHDGGLFILDLDTCSIGDPAIDVGNLAAHLRARGDDSAAAALEGAFRTIDRAALATWRDTASFRLRCQQVLVDHSLGMEPG
ncbi:MAG: aminoglycoside phosphotransferase family protein [Acidimicrobiia bacterium]